MLLIILLVKEYKWKCNCGFPWENNYYRVEKHITFTVRWHSKGLEKEKKKSNSARSFIFMDMGPTSPNECSRSSHTSVVFNASLRRTGLHPKLITLVCAFHPDAYITSCSTQGHSTLSHCAYLAYWLLTTADNLLGLVVLMIEKASLWQEDTNSQGWHIWRVQDLQLPEYLKKILKNIYIGCCLWTRATEKNTLPLLAWKSAVKNVFSFAPSKRMAACIHNSIVNTSGTISSIQIQNICIILRTG